MSSNRVAIALGALVAVAISALASCQTQPVGEVRPPASPSTTASSGAISSVAPTMDLPAARRLVPTAVIDLAGMVTDTIPLTTDGRDVWVGVDGAVIRIASDTNATHRTAVAAMTTGNGSIALTPEGLWIEDHNASHLVRVDPATGDVELTSTTPEPLGIVFVDDQLWINSQEAPGAHRVDRATGSWGESWIGTSNLFAIGLGNVWVGEWDGFHPEADHASADLITRYDSATGAAAGTITVPAGTGCAVSGVFPGNAWAWCPSDFGTCPADAVAVRIDPATNRVATTARICGNPAAVINGTPWFLVGRREGDDDAYSLVSVDPATGNLIARLDMGTCDPDEFELTSSALWVSDEQHDRVLRYALSAFRS